MRCRHRDGLAVLARHFAARRDLHLEIGGGDVEAAVLLLEQHVLGEEAVDPVESACINCGRCLRACPMQLMPTLLDRCVRADRYDEAEKYGIMNCIECGACTFVCPAKRLLTQSCRQGKKVITTRKKAEAAKKAAAEAAKKAAEEQSKKEA